MGVLCREIRFAFAVWKNMVRCITNVDIIYGSFVAEILRYCKEFGILAGDEGKTSKQSRFFLKLTPMTVIRLYRVFHLC